MGDEDDYFQTLEDNTELILLHSGDRWSPFVSQDVTDNGAATEASQRLISILLRLEAEPGTIALLSEEELELVSSVEDYDCSNFPRYDKTFLEHLKKAAEKHLVEKGQIRDTLALLKIYHRANENLNQREKRDSNSTESSRKKHKATK